MSDPLDRLEALRDTPLPQLAPAELIRSRGQQRARRARSLLAATGACAVLLAGGTAVALSGTDVQTLQPARPQVTSTPPPSVLPPLPVPSTVGPQTPPPGATPPVTSPAAPSPRTSRTAAAPPTTPRATPSSPSAGPTDPRIPAGALVSADRLGSSWQRTRSSRSAPTQESCAITLLTGDAGVAYLSGGYVTMDGPTPAPEASGFSQEVVRFPSAAAAAQAAAALRADTSSCPVLTDSLTTVTMTKVGDAPEVVQISYVQDGQPSPFADYRGVVVAGDLVSRWLYQDPHGVTQAQAEHAAGLVQAALCSAAGDC